MLVCSTLFALAASLLRQADGPLDKPMPIASAPQSTAAAPAPSPLGLAGTYTDETGSPIVVALSGSDLTLASGPMTFTLSQTGSGRYRARERDLDVAFAEDGLTITEGGRTVAIARRGATTAVITPQGAHLSQWLEDNVPALLRRYHVPAAAIAYIDHGRVAWTKVYGERRHGEPARLDTLFNVASLTKPITAEVILRLASDHRLDIDAPMSAKFVDPDLASDHRATMLTVRMALQHRTGLPNWRSQTGNFLTFLNEPGARFHYAGEGYTYAAHYAERVTGEPFEELARKRVFTPFGMNDTYYTVTSAFADRVAYPHDRQGQELWPAIRLDFSGACCLHTTIGDYARFVAGVMTDRALDPRLAEERFALEPDRRNEMCDDAEGLRSDICPPRIAMGLGWFVFGFRQDVVIAHTGVNDGERSAAFFVPSRGIGYVILTNGANGAKLIRDVTAASYDNPEYREMTEYLAR